MRLANLDGRLVLVRADAAADVEKASDGLFPNDPQAVYERWDEFRRWAADAESSSLDYAPFETDLLGPPAPAPRQLLAVGLNYRDHAEESGFAVPSAFPPTFTKFVSCLTGPTGQITLPEGGHTDWEVELVVVIGRRARRIAAADAWAHVAGLTIGQDLSERLTQMAGSAPQFSLGKSFPGFGPLGPVLVTPDEFDDPDDLALSSTLNGEVVQEARTAQMIFPVPAVLEHLSSVVELLPGDVVFTGTPAGVAMGRTPPRWIHPGDELVSAIEGIGEMRHRFVAGADRG